MEGSFYNAGRYLPVDPAKRGVSSDSNFKLRNVASALYGIPGCDATEEQIANAKKAVTWWRTGKPVAYILLMLRIRSKVTQGTLDSAVVA